MIKNKVEICGINTKELKVLPEKEKIKLLVESKHGSLIAREKLVNGNLKLVLSVIQKFIGRGEALDDLFQIGCIGLIKSIDNFDISQNTRFSTYAVPMIIGEIRRYLRDNNSVKVSRSMKDIAYKAISLKEKLLFEKGREPTIEEISEELMLPRETVAIALEAIVDPISLQEPVYSDVSGTENVYVIDQIGDNSDDNDWINEILIKQNAKKLNEREKTILYLRFFKGFTQNQVANKLNISQAQVSRLEKNVISKIKNHKN